MTLQLRSNKASTVARTGRCHASVSTGRIRLADPEGRNATMPGSGLQEEPHTAKIWSAVIVSAEIDGSGVGSVVPVDRLENLAAFG